MKRRSFLTMLGAVFAAPKLPISAPPVASGSLAGFPMLRADFPLMLAKDLVSVQPMSGPIGEVFAMNINPDKVRFDLTEVEELARGYCPLLMVVRRGIRQPLGRTVHTIIADDFNLKD